MATRKKRGGRRGSTGWLSERPLPLWVLVVTDVVIFAIALNVFALFHHVLPRRETSTGLVSDRYRASALASDAAAPAQPSPDEGPAMDLSEFESETIPFGTDVAEEEAAPPAEEAPEEEPAAIDAEPEEDAEEGGAPMTASALITGYFGDRFPEKFTGGESVKSRSGYRNGNVNITLSKHTHNQAVFYVADIYLKDIQCLKTAFANDTFGTGQHEWPRYVNKRAGGIVAITGDNYGARSGGVVIRNGELYRDKNISMDVCVIYWDGTMQTYGANSFDARTAIENGAYQAWNFGPTLLDADGNPVARFSDTTVEPRNPRSAIGYFEPGHYCFVVVDGRSKASKGVTLRELAQLMSQMGCKQAYNLDGGNTAMMMVGDQVVNNPSSGGRPSSDIILITAY